jgi:predicted ATPase
VPPRRPRRPRDLDAYGFLRAVSLIEDKVSSFDEYPFSIPAVRKLGALDLDPKVTFLVGENGSGKSTLVEAIAVAAGFNAEGGSKNFNFATRRSESSLHEALRLTRGVRREKDGFFLRTESYFNVGTQIDELGVASSYGGRSPHEQSHGESFLALANHRLRGNGLYIFDEPEAALSPGRQLALLQIIRRLVEEKTRSQFVIATHSPILMAYPGALIYHLGSEGIAPVRYEDTEHYQVTRTFLTDSNRYFKHLFADEDSAPQADE